MSSIDFYPAILEMTGVADEPEHRSDGVSLLPLLLETGEWTRDTLYWHYPHYSNAGSTPMGAIRQGRFKLIEHFEDGRLELYDLESDRGETTDLAQQMGALARELHGKLAAWRKSVGAKMPRPNPNYDPARAKQRTQIPD